ncbi:AAA family ATPase [Variovorax boronicumulans]|uniref:AAA family ATPase n=1 Tax=Variovorax boronicumulans TaxID=436515 RepID=UPI000AFA9FD9|nr:AAA family ATPase [Variovorax boronicumulans]
MAKQITIEGLKQIDKLVFDVPSPGVYILSGTNGAGKSCLLACLLRIGWANAFQLSFRTSKISTALDVFSGSKITYEINNSKVEYTYSGERWIPKPKSQSKLLTSFGYGQVIYAAANSERIEPRAEDFKPQRVRDASQSLKDAAEKILSDVKFQSLKVINVRRGVGSEAYLIPDARASAASKKNAYYSEKNFSLGEICVLKLLRQLENCPHGSLVLIDELELALHPKAQVKLFEYLQKISTDKQLTTIFSTHSVNLIKSIKRENFFFIEQNSGKTNLVSGCYPTYALGQIALREERSPDIVLYVEDEQAQFIVSALVQALIEKELAGKSKPTIVVAPIGTFEAVIAFLTRSRSLMPDSVKQFALLDKDVYDEYTKPLKTAGNHAELTKISRVQDQINYLPWTPEVGLCTLLHSDITGQERALREYFGDARISLSHINFHELTPLSNGPLRKKSKALVKEVISEIAAIKIISPERTRQDLSEYFANACLTGSQAASIKKLLLPIIRS